MVCSKSRKGDWWDNAPIAISFGTLETERKDDGSFPTREAARTADFGFSEGFYNRQRLPSVIGSISPIRK